MTVVADICSRHILTLYFTYSVCFFTLVMSDASVMVNAVDGLSVVVAAGPFSTSDNILYEPLVDLMSCLSAGCPPDVCILVCTSVVTAVVHC